jgi:hypothetical protein
VGSSSPQQSPCKGSAKRIGIALAGRIYGCALTHRVAVGCYALPLQGGGELAILLAFLAIFNDFYIKIPMLIYVLPTVRNMSYISLNNTDRFVILRSLPTDQQHFLIQSLFLGKNRY